MPKPLDIFLGLEISKGRQAAIDAVRAHCCSDDSSFEFWAHVARVERICKSADDQAAIAKALALIGPRMSPDGEFGRMAIFESDIDRLIRDVATR